MRILVYPHSLEVGGSQINAIELGAAVRDLGHHVTVFAAEPGPLSNMIAGLNLPLVLAPSGGRRPSWATATVLRRHCRDDRVDVVHGYEWPPCLDGFYGPGLRDGVAVGCTVMSMAVAPFIPRSMPLIVGTAQIAAATRPGRRCVDVIEPPVDTVLNDCTIDGTEFRARYDLGNRPTVVVVSRLVAALKLEGLERAVGAARILASQTGLRLVIIGDGPARAILERAAAAVNACTGEPTVLLTGELADPRPAYAAADVVLGMGGSALRAMAFAKPVVVLGELGFAELLTAESTPTFLWQGFYGLGDGDRSPDRLARLLRSLLVDPAHRAECGSFARSLVVSRFSLSRAAERQVDCYRAWLGHRPPRAALVADATRTTAGLVAHKVRRRIHRWLGSEQADDFNTVTQITRVAGVAGAAT